MFCNHNEYEELDYNKSFPFDVIKYEEIDLHTDHQIRVIVDTVWKTLPFRTLTKKSSRKKYREVVKNYVLNLIKSYQSGYCIRVSRNRNDYHYIERYSHIFTTPVIIIKAMDALEENDWIDIHIGFYDHQKNKGKQTRIFPSQKFIYLVENMSAVNGNNKVKRVKFTHESSKEIIQLRHKISDNQFRFVSYKDTLKTITMRNRLSAYNEFMGDTLDGLTILELSRKELETMSDKHRIAFDNQLLSGSIELSDKIMRRNQKAHKCKKQEPALKPKISRKQKHASTFDLEEIEGILYEDISIVSKRRRSKEHAYSFGNEGLASGGNNPSTDQYIQTTQNLSPPIPSPLPKPSQSQPKTQRTERNKNQKNTIPITKTLTQNNKQFYIDTKKVASAGYEENDYHSVEEILQAFPRNRKFYFRIIFSRMFRAFSDTSKTFTHHGRFYGDPVQNLPSWMRTKIKMRTEGDGTLREVVECDYASMHPTMLYVMAGATPPENIYMIDKKADPQLRKEYKTVFLVAINHKNPDTMWSAVSSHFREEFGYTKGNERLTKKYIMGIYEKLLEHNKPISKHMNTGVAMRLMRKDSEIADRIMIEFIVHGIPIRCIHDSFIVPAKFENELKVLMVEYFQEIMETDYVIEITTETAKGKKVQNVERLCGKVAVEEPLSCKEEKNDEFAENMRYFKDIIAVPEIDREFILPDDFQPKRPRRLATIHKLGVPFRTESLERFAGINI